MSEVTNNQNIKDVSAKEAQKLDGLQHYTMFPFDLSQERAGGLPSAFEEAVQRGKNLTVFTADTTDFKWKGADVRGADPEVPNPGDRYKLWFGTGIWQWINPDAHTTEAASPKALKAMFPTELLDEMQLASNCKPGSVEFMLEYAKQFAPSLKHETDFGDRFSDLMNSVKPRTVVNFQDFFAKPLMQKHAQTLRANGVYMTHHWHTNIPM